MSDKPKKPLVPWTKPKRKTYDEVFSELVSDLCDQGNKALTQRINLGAKRSLQNLEQVYQQLALQTFKKQYGYGYSAKPFSPINAAPNTNSVVAFDGFFRVKDSHKPLMEQQTPNSGSKSDSVGGEASASKPIGPLVPDTSMTPAEIQDALQKRLSSLPDQCIHDAKARLREEVVSVLSPPKGGPGAPSMWTDHSLPVDYVVSGDRYENTVHGDLLFIGVYGSRKDGTVTAELVGFYIIGVYYYILSPAKLAKQSIWASLCDRANSSLGRPLAISQPPTPDDLTRILSIYGPRQFSSDSFFGMDFNSTPGESVEFLGRCQELFICEDDKLSELKGQLDARIFTAIQAPEWTRARKEITEQVIYLANDTVQNNGEWKSVKFDQTYLPEVTSELTVAVKATFVHCILVSPQFPDISFRCVNISGLFYKVTGAKDTISGDFIKTLYSSARSLIPENNNHIPAPDAPTKDDLDALLSAAREYKFEDKFHFKFDGANTHPPDAIAGGALYAATGSFEADKTTDADLLVDTLVMKAFNFPEWRDEEVMKDMIRSNLFNRVNNALEQVPFAIGANQWVTSETEQGYPYTGKDGTLLYGKLIFIHCNGSMSQISQKMSINKTFGYFVGVYYDQETTDW